MAVMPGVEALEAAFMGSANAPKGVVQKDTSPDAEAAAVPKRTMSVLIFTRWETMQGGEQHLSTAV